MRTTVGLLTVSLVCVPLAACGGSGGGTSVSDNIGVRRTIGTLTDAARAGDGKKICNQIFTPLLKKSVTTAAKRPCAVEVKQKLFAKNAQFNVADVAVQGNQATVRVTDQFHKTSIISLVRANGAWRISGVTAASS